MFSRLNYLENLLLGKNKSKRSWAELFKNLSPGELGIYADSFKKRLYGKEVTYIKNMHLNLTNICVQKCRFCSFRKSSGEEGAYALEIDEALELVRSAAKTGIREVHIVNALNPDLSLDYYTTIIRDIKKEFPHLTVKGLTAVEIDYISKREEVTHEFVIDSLIEAGVELFPGGGAEIFSQDIRKKLGTSKTSGEVYLHIHRLIHKRGIKSNVTMLYGHFESPEDILDHLIKIRNLQDETGGFSAFIPLRFVSKNTPIRANEPGAHYDLKVIAFSRIYLDNIPHIKAYWVSLTPEVAQVALSFGADDVDGTIYKENIITSAGAEVKPSMTEEELRRLILDAGAVPVERDSHFNKIV